MTEHEQIRLKACERQLTILRENLSELFFKLDAALAAADADHSEALAKAAGTTQIPAVLPEKASAPLIYQPQSPNEIDLDLPEEPTR